MSQSTTVWAILLLALITANLPFLNNRLLAVIQLSGPAKPLALRLAELVFFYFVAGGVGLLFENRIGQIAPRGWEFYVVTGALYLVLAFPGFVFRYLLKHRN